MIWPHCESLNGTRHPRQLYAAPKVLKTNLQEQGLHQIAEMVACQTSSIVSGRVVPEPAPGLEIESQEIGGAQHGASAKNVIMNGTNFFENAHPSQPGKTQLPPKLTPHALRQRPTLLKNFCGPHNLKSHQPLPAFFSNRFL
jgi:hypothetical protein